MNTYGFQQFFTIEKLKKSAEPALIGVDFTRSLKRMPNQSF
jgi:hypothetical protein